MMSERKGRLWQVLCYRALYKTGGLDLKSRRKGVDSPSVYLLPWKEQTLG